MSKSQQRKVFDHLESLGYKTIAVNAGLRELTGSQHAAVLISQILYWQGLGRNKRTGEIYKTIKELEQETGLSRHQQDHAIHICIKLGILSVRNRGIPPKRHFLIDVTELTRQVHELQNSSNTNCEKPTIRSERKSQNNTKNTKYISQREKNINLVRIKQMKEEYNFNKGWP